MVFHHTPQSNKSVGTLFESRNFIVTIIDTAILSERHGDEGRGRGIADFDRHAKYGYQPLNTFRLS
jgi:hypothetical protein